MVNDELIRILFLASDPSDAVRLRLGQELRDIQEKLKLAKHRDRFILDQRMSVRPGDISQALLDFEPHIVHFSGHGASSGELCFEDNQGRTKTVHPKALSALFELVADQVNCVILNACHSQIQAQAIAEHIPFVIGMNQAIGDQAAITFASGFYKALGASRSIVQAYRFGLADIQLHNISEHLTPILIQKQTKILNVLNLANNIEIQSSTHLNASSTHLNAKAVCEEGQGKTRANYEVILQANLEDVDGQFLIALVEGLRQISGDVSLTLKRIEMGSIRLILEGSYEGLQQLQSLSQRDQLNSTLFQGVLQGLMDGVLIVTSQGELVSANASAKRICNRLINQENSQLSSVPQSIWNTCQALIESQDALSRQHLVVEDEIVLPADTKIRVRVRWLELGSEPYLLVTLEDQHQSAQYQAMAEARKYGLTERETDVWLLRQEGYTYRKIAAQLFISEATVKKYIKSIFVKRTTLFVENE